MLLQSTVKRKQCAINQNGARPEDTDYQALLIMPHMCEVGMTASLGVTADTKNPSGKTQS